jgi:hypothetical protein
MFCIYLEESGPKAVSKDHAGRNTELPATPVATTFAESRQVVRREVGARWDKFSAQELAALNDRDDLVRAVVARYGVENSQAQHDVDLLLKGRRI